MAGQDVAVITGAGGNLGRAVSIELANQGFKLVCLSHSQGSLEATLKALPSSADVVSMAGLDLTDAEGCRSAIDVAVKKFGTISGLVNTVGGFKMAPVGIDMIEQWDHMMNVNARAALSISSAVLPVMRANGYGRIVHIAANAGLKAGSNQAAYAASKAALMRLTESIAAECRPFRVTANCVVPGTIDTPQNRADMPNADTSAWVSSQSIAQLIAFLLSPSSSAVTGAAIPATGLA